MKATVLAAGVLLGALFAATPVHAQYYYNPAIPPCPTPIVWYQQNCLGQWYGPNCYVTPPCQPFQGMVFAPPRQPMYGMPPRPGMVAVPGQAPMPAMPGMGGTAAFPTHPWARSPRDFFMWE